MMCSSRIGLCSRIRDTDWRQAGRISVLSWVALFGLFVVFGLGGIRINTTPSLPVGIYVVTDDNTPLIEFCPAGAPGAMAARRGYRTAGDCPDGASALLKPIVARAGDVVELTADGIWVNERLIRNTAPLSVDTEHRPLEHYPYGRCVVSQGEVWVASSYNKRSFDSRYYGPVPTRDIRAHLRALLTL